LTGEGGGEKILVVTRCDNPDPELAALLKIKYKIKITQNTPKEKETKGINLAGEELVSWPELILANKKKF
jgi:hypothetical protein